ncbi:uncharacterized protein [Rutidosis leptorrhynchoides]|uniref:uncharacterized protein n=1 Tax=Rutidosis leptorrhynchoides TaxID=125765 RepID=UPI003A99A668
MTKLLEKYTSFSFDDDYLKAFSILKDKLINAPIIVSLDWSEPFELMCDASPDQINRRCFHGKEADEILLQCHHSASGGQFGPNYIARKVLDVGFYWSAIFKDAHKLLQTCGARQRGENISKCDEMPEQNIQVCEIFDVWGIDFMGPFPSSQKCKYILVVVDYDSGVVVDFLKKLFCRFGIQMKQMEDCRVELNVWKI